MKQVLFTPYWLSGSKKSLQYRSNSLIDNRLFQAVTAAVKHAHKIIGSRLILFYESIACLSRENFP